jgi:peptide/nickel transport system permease protein
MWNYAARRLLHSVPVFLGILLILMFLLREGAADPVYAFLGKQASPEDVESLRARMGLDRPFLLQYLRFVGEVLTLDFDQESWGRPGQTVGELLASAIVPTLLLTVPALAITTLISIGLALVSASYRGRLPDRLLMAAAVVGMSISFAVYIVVGQYFGAYRLNAALGFELFAIEGFEASLAGWFKTCTFPVAISVIVATGYDARFYRAALVEECGRDYVTTARAKGASSRRVLFVHVLVNALVPILTRVMITLPFLMMGSVLLEHYFGIPGMGNRLLTAIDDRDFPVIQGFTAVFAAVFIVSNLLTDLLYAAVDPRVRLR